ncbi:MAG: CAP domain-containing protein, partial [Actinomycetota bacterium]|nr:CAP domain-containing protein [Actinomycetota bacterium]
MRKLIRLVASVGLISLTALTLVPARASADTITDETQFVTKLNTLRVSLGVRPIAVHPELTTMARNWSVQMAAAGTISHNPNMTAQAPTNWARIGENVGMGPSVDALHNAFVASPAHYANMINPYYDSVGVGVVQSGSTKFVTVNFMATQGAPDPSAPPPPTTGTSGTFNPVTPARILDTRNGTGQGGRKQKVGPREVIVVDVTGPGGVPASGVTSVVMNVTSTQATAPSFLSVTPSGGNSTSSLNFVPGVDVANLVTVPVGPDG